MYKIFIEGKEIKIRTKQGVIVHTISNIWKKYKFLEKNELKINKDIINKTKNKIANKKNQIKLENWSRRNIFLFKESWNKPLFQNIIY
jgi:type II secretory pathway component PulC